MGNAAACLTFDDWHVSGWFGARDLFRRYSARVTFFIARPRTLGDEDLRRLHILQDDGHEIGCHTMDHIYFPKWIRPRSPRQYVDEQVLAALDLQRRQGFAVTSFSYPHFKYHPRVTGQIMQHMRMVREAGPLENPIHALLPRSNNGVVAAMGVLDITGMDLPLSYVEERLDLIARHGGAGVFVGHAIAPDAGVDPRQVCSLEDMEAILAAARDRKVEMVPMREIGFAEWKWTGAAANTRADAAKAGSSGA